MFDGLDWASRPCDPTRRCIKSSPPNIVAFNRRVMDMKLLEVLMDNLKRVVKENIDLKAEIMRLNKEMDSIYGV